MRKLIVEGSNIPGTKITVTVTTESDTSQEIKVSCVCEYAEGTSEDAREIGEHLAESIKEGLSLFVKKDMDYYPTKDVLPKAQRSLLSIYLPTGIWGSLIMRRLLIITMRE